MIVVDPLTCKHFWVSTKHTGIEQCIHCRTRRDVCLLPPNHDRNESQTPNDEFEESL